MRRAAAHGDEPADDLAPGGLPAPRDRAGLPGARLQDCIVFNASFLASVIVFINTVTFARNDS